jgi:hypothetical protein
MIDHILHGIGFGLGFGLSMALLGLALIWAVYRAPNVGPEDDL